MLEDLDRKLHTFTSRLSPTFPPKSASPPLSPSIPLPILIIFECRIKHLSLLPSILRPIRRSLRLPASSRTHSEHPANRTSTLSSCSRRSSRRIKPTALEISSDLWLNRHGMLIIFVLLLLLGLRTCVYLFLPFRITTRSTRSFALTFPFLHLLCEYSALQVFECKGVLVLPDTYRRW